MRFKYSSLCFTLQSMFEVRYHLLMHSPVACEELEGLSPDMTLDQYVQDQLKVWSQAESHHVHPFRIIFSCSNMLFIEKTWILQYGMICGYMYIWFRTIYAYMYNTYDLCDMCVCVWHVDIACSTRIGWYTLSLAWRPSFVPKLLKRSCLATWNGGWFLWPSCKNPSCGGFGQS